MKKIDKAMQIEMERLEERIAKTKFPHNYGMNDRATESDFVCGSDCKACWNEEVEGDSNARTET